VGRYPTGLMWNMKEGAESEGGVGAAVGLRRRSTEYVLRGDQVESMERRARVERQEAVSDGMVGWDEQVENAERKTESRRVVAARVGPQVANTARSQTHKYLTLP
jgi:hypothetical protein